MLPVAATAALRFLRDLLALRCLRGLAQPWPVA